MGVVGHVHVVRMGAIAKSRLLVGRRGVFVVVTALLVAAGSATAAGSGWSIQHTPNPTSATSGASLSGIACASNSACTAVGDYGNGAKVLTLAERWSGKQWSIQDTPNPAGAYSVFTGVSCVSQSACTAVGQSNNVTLAEHWNGKRWSIQHTPNPTGPTTSILLSVSCASQSACTAVGYDDKGAVEAPLADRWNGTKWSLQRTPLPAGTAQSQLRGVACTSPSACTAVGFYYNGTAHVPLAERWNRTKGSLQHVPNPTGFDSFDGVACISHRTCTAVGDYNTGTGYVTLVERWNGKRWFIQDTPNPAGSRQTILYGIGCSAGTACTAVGERAPRKLRTFAERWNGSKWSIQNTPYPSGSRGAVLNGIACTSRSTCTAAGGYGDTSNLAMTLAERWNGR